MVINKNVNHIELSKNMGGNILNLIIYENSINKEKFSLILKSRKDFENKSVKLCNLTFEELEIIKNNLSAAIEILKGDKNTKQ